MKQKQPEIREVVRIRRGMPGSIERKWRSEDDVGGGGWD